MIRGLPFLRAGQGKADNDRGQRLAGYVTRRRSTIGRTVGENSLFCSRPYCSPRLRPLPPSVPMEAIGSRALTLAPPTPLTAMMKRFLPACQQLRARRLAANVWDRKAHALSPVPLQLAPAPLSQSGPVRYKGEHRIKHSPNNNNPPERRVQEERGGLYLWYRMFPGGELSPCAERAAPIEGSGCARHPSSIVKWRIIRCHNY